MGRTPTKNLYRDRRRVFAALLEAALKKGQRGDGETAEEHWTPWTVNGFRKTIHHSEAAVRKWLDPDDPTLPKNIVPVLKTLFGDLPRYQDQRKAMHAAWHAAGGIEPMVPPDTRAIKTDTFSEVAEIVQLLANQPVPDNQGGLIVPYTLRFRHDRNRKIDVVLQGKVQKVSIDIGLSEPIFAVKSSHWQPKAETVFRDRADTHPRTKAGPFGDSVTVTGEKAGPIVVGTPFAEEPHLMMEKTKLAGDGPIEFSVLSDADSVHVTPSGGGDVPRTRRAVIAAIFASDIPRDNSDRLIVARVQVTPGEPAKDDE